MRGAAKAVALALLLFAGAWWGWQSWSARDGEPKLRAPSASRNANGGRDERDDRDVAAATAPVAPEAPVDRLPAAVRDEAPRAVVAPRDRTPRARQPFVLRVVDAETRRELRDVEVKRWPSSRMFDGVQFPAEFHAKLASFARGDSPLKLAPPVAEPPAEPSPIDELEVAAAGYESKRLRVEWTGGGERQVELKAGGALRIVVKHAPAGALLVAHLFDEERLFDQLPQQEGRRSKPLRDPVDALVRDAFPHRIESTEGATFEPIEALADGIWLVVLYDRAVAGDPRVAAGDIQVEAGGTADLELDYEVATAKPLVPAAGRIVFDAAWLETKVGVVVDPPPPPTRLSCWQAGRPTLRREAAQWDVALAPGPDPAVVPFDAGWAVAGEMIVRLEGWSWTTAIEVPEGGSRELELVVPPPADLALTLRDAMTGAPLAGARVVVRMAASTTEPLWKLPWSRTLDPSDEAGRCGCRIPRDVVALLPGLDGDEALRSTTRLLGPGPNAIELSIGRLATLEVLLRDGDAIVPWEHEFVVVASTADGALPSAGSVLHDRDPASHLKFDAAGDVRIVVDGVPGYVPTDPVDVALVRGESTSVEIPLRRRN